MLKNLRKKPTILKPIMLKGAEFFTEETIIPYIVYAVPTKYFTSLTTTVVTVNYLTTLLVLNINLDCHISQMILIP